jgi:tripartite-type tricarboxylate transporter receptor subunit TctC
MKTLIATVVAAVLVMAQAAIHAQSYPSKPIRFVIPFGPGSASDALARIAGQDLSQALGQPVVVVHKPGADGALSALDVKRSAADGYTFLFGTNSPLAVVPNIRKEPPYDVMADFTPVTFLGDNTFFIVVHPSVPAKSIAELIAYAKANPKRSTMRLATRTPSLRRPCTRRTTASRCTPSRGRGPGQAHGQGAYAEPRLRCEIIHA